MYSVKPIRIRGSILLGGTYGMALLFLLASGFLPGGFLRGGALSVLGLFLLAGGTAVTLFTAGLLPAGRRPRGLLFALAGLTGLLLLDETFWLSDYLGSTYSGLPEAAFFSVFVALGLTILLYFRYSWLLLPIGPFVVAGLLLVGSRAIELLDTSTFQWAYPTLSNFLSEGLTLLGIAGWTGALTWACARSLKAAAWVDSRLAVSFDEELSFKVLPFVSGAVPEVEVPDLEDDESPPPQESTHPQTRSSSEDHSDREPAGA